VRVGDPERERAASALRKHYVEGRLSLEEFSDRTGRALGASSRAELRTALSDLPVFPEARELVAQGRTAIRAALHGVAVLLFTGLYLLFSFTLLIVFGVTLLVEGASTALLVAFLLVWLLPTYLLARLWRRRPLPPPTRQPST
jgi:Flp pilus assembly protein TadB